MTFSNEGLDIVRVLLTGDTRNIVVETRHQGHGSLWMSPIDTIDWDPVPGQFLQQHVTQVPGMHDVLYSIIKGPSAAVHSSSDGGAIWQLVKSVPTNWGNEPQGLAVSRDQRTLYLFGYSGIYVSRDQGEWTSPAELAIIEFGTVVSSPHSDLTALASGGYSGNIYRIADHGTSWVHSGQGIPAGVNDLTVDPRNRQRLMVASYGGGVLSSEDGGAS